jgi:hypothetical protein
MEQVPCHISNLLINYVKSYLWTPWLVLSAVTVLRKLPTPGNLRSEVENYIWESRGL